MHAHAAAATVQHRMYSIYQGRAHYNSPYVWIAIVPAGLVNLGPQSQSRVATWPTAAAELMAAPQAQSAPAVSPASSGSAGSFSNKRRKLESSDSTARQARQSAFHSAQLPTKQAEEPACDTSNADLASDADSDPHTTVAAPQHRNADSSLTYATLSSRRFSDQQVSTQAPDLLASPEKLPTDPGDPTDAEHGSIFSNQSPANDDAISDSMPDPGFVDFNEWLVNAKGKMYKGPSPLPHYDPEQESKLDHTRAGNWVWWKLDSMWTFAKVGAPPVPFVSPFCMGKRKEKKRRDKKIKEKHGT